MTAGRVAIFAALRWECRPVLRHLRQVHRDRLGPFPTWTGRAGPGEAVVVQTGIGAERAGAAADAIRAAGAFSLYLSTGCAGALAPDLGPGDLAVATAVVSAGDDGRIATDDAATARARRVAARLDVRTCCGPILSSPRVLHSAHAKRDAGRRTGAVAVEMEGAAIGAYAGRAEVPFASVRAILDTADTELDEAGNFLDPASGRLRPLGLARHVVRHPATVRQLLALRRMLHAAERSLDRFFAAFFWEQ
ncbi:hypothetical protein L6Q96_12445 [Candidatus Binatia bacterium]|nr:hypothetical protein [Candidatus Binatia bacterium]